MPETRSASQTAGSRRQAWVRFRAHRPALVGLIMICGLVSAALLAPLFTSVGLLPAPDQLDVRALNAGIGLHHLAGTDNLGRDLLSRALSGARFSLSLAVMVQAIALVIGGALGLIAGYVGGVVDAVIMRLVDLMYAFPALLFALVVLAVLGPGYVNLLIAISAVSWPQTARLVRGQVLNVVRRDYVAAARLSGTPPVKIIRRHIIPNAFGPIIISIAFGIPIVIFFEAFLSFVGVGVRPPTPSWGAMINRGYQAVYAYPLEVIVPAIAIAIATLSFNLVGDGLRDALDPRLRSQR
ncbi:MAG: ABC transporter permease [Acidimicrobiales bacterium]